MKRNTIDDCVLSDLGCISSRSGRITAVEARKDGSFDIERVFYLFDVPSGADRGGHSHKELKQLIVAASGAFSVLLDDGFAKKKVDLNRPHIGLLVPPWVWSELVNFSSGAVCLVLASQKYDAADYIRDYDEYRKYVGA
jgi:hypothetical protein